MWEAGGKDDGEGRWDGNGKERGKTYPGIIRETHLCTYLWRNRASTWMMSASINRTGWWLTMLKAEKTMLWRRGGMKNTIEH
jgi:hypothetical protein